MEIVRLTVEEGPRLRRLRLRALEDAPDAFGSTLAETQARPPESWPQQLRTLPTFAAVIDGEDVGMVRGAPDPEAAGDAWLISMWVAPSARRSGVGVRLVEAVVAWAAAAGFSRLLLDVADDNVPAIRLYARLGFAPTGVTGALPPPRAHITEHQRARPL